MRIPALAVCLISLYFAFLGCSFEFKATVKSRPSSENQNEGRRLLLPIAAKNASVFSLGKSVDPKTGKKVEGMAFITREKGFAKSNAKNKTGDKNESQCYAFLTKDAKWKNAENYIFDPTNNRDLNHATLKKLLKTCTETWNEQVPASIFGTEVEGMVDNTSFFSLNGKNEVYFGSISDPKNQKAIALTMAWRISEGPAWQREILEWDTVFNHTDYDWSTKAIGVAGKIDFLNIAMHEVGHAAGMAHPSDSCTEETMYGHATWAETKKRTLNAGDIAGIKELYK